MAAAPPPPGGPPEGSKANNATKANKANKASKAKGSTKTSNEEQGNYWPGGMCGALKYSIGKTYICGANLRFPRAPEGHVARSTGKAFFQRCNIKTNYRMHISSAGIAFFNVAPLKIAPRCNGRPSNHYKYNALSVQRRSGWSLGSIFDMGGARTL